MILVALNDSHLKKIVWFKTIMIKTLATYDLSDSMQFCILVKTLSSILDSALVFNNLVMNTSLYTHQSKVQKWIGICSLLLCYQESN